MLIVDLGAIVALDYRASIASVVSGGFFYILVRWPHNTDARVSQVTTACGVVLSNVPLINLRWEFREFHRCANDPTFLKEVEGRSQPLTTKYFVWAGMPEAGATMMLGRSIIGLEAYLRASAQFEGAIRGTSTPKLKEASTNPFVLGRHAADNYFNRLPALVESGLALRIVDAALWDQMNVFYREIRNPIFHGSQLSEVTSAQFAALYGLLGRVYEWIDSWHSPEVLGIGAKPTFALHRSPPAT